MTGQRRETCLATPGAGWSPPLVIVRGCLDFLTTWPSTHRLPGYTSGLVIRPVAVSVKQTVRTVTLRVGSTWIVAPVLGRRPAISERPGRVLPGERGIRERTSRPIGIGLSPVCAHLNACCDRAAAEPEALMLHYLMGENGCNALPSGNTGSCSAPIRLRRCCCTRGDPIRCRRA
jgi:hypothetical protein